MRCCGRHLPLLQSQLQLSGAIGLRRLRPRPSDHWHLDEMVVIINGKRHWLWRAVDNEGEVLDFLVQSRRNAKAGTVRISVCGRHNGREGVSLCPDARSR